MSNNSCSFWEEIQEELLRSGDSFFEGFRQEKDFLCKPVANTRIARPREIKYAMVAATREYSPKFPSPVRVEIVFESSDKNLNRTRYNKLEANKTEIERRLGVDNELTWDNKTGRDKYKIIIESDFENREDGRKAVIRWLMENIKKLKYAAEPYLEDLK